MQEENKASGEGNWREMGTHSSEPERNNKITDPNVTTEESAVDVSTKLERQHKQECWFWCDELWVEDSH